MSQLQPSGSASIDTDPVLRPLRFPKVRKGPDGKLVVVPGAGLEVKNRVFRSSISGQFDHYNGTGSEVRIRWEEKFARGGVGAIISSFVPVLLEGRILPRYAMIHHDRTIRFWSTVAERVHAAGGETGPCKFIVQLSHGGRQRDVPGVENIMEPGKSSTSKPDSFHGLTARAMTIGEIEGVIAAFAAGARRARDAGVDGVELHASHGYLFTQFLSSAINDRTDKYGGSLENRARFLIEVIRAIRAEVGWDFHVQAKINILDLNRAYFPLEWKQGNTTEEALKIFAWAEEEGLNALHVSAGSTFPHPLVPPGAFPVDEAAWWYGVMCSSGTRAYLNYTLFHFPWLRWVFRLVWNRTKRKYPIEGVTSGVTWDKHTKTLTPKERPEGCHVVRNEAVARAALRGTRVSAEDESAGAMAHIPVLNTGGYQDGALIRSVLRSGVCDGVAIARPLIANDDLVNAYFRKGKDMPDTPCTFCNRCLINALANPLACYDQTRFATREEMIAKAMEVFPLDYHPEVANGLHE
jgi:2,4-dienoyl-CoA reductase (NADPH2)